MVTITERAAEKALALLAAENDPELTGLRVAVEGGGCSGFQYALGFDGAPEQDDRVEVVNGLRIIVGSPQPAVSGRRCDRLSRTA